MSTAMYIYKVSQDTNQGHDTYNSFVCVAENTAEAMRMHPQNEHHSQEFYGFDEAGNEFYERDGDYEPVTYSTWANLYDLEVVFIGKAPHGSPPRIVITSFNAG